MKENKNPETLQITEEMNGLRLDKAMSFHEKVASRSRAEFLIESGLVLLNGKKAKRSEQVTLNDTIVFYLPDPAEKLAPLDISIDILFEDKDVIVINKPAGLVVHPAAGHENDTLVNALIHHSKNLSMKFGENRPGIVHRLDRDTSGVLVVAKNDVAHELLSKQFKNRTIKRKYKAICLGFPAKPSGTVQSYIARHPSDRKKFASLRNEKGKIITEFGESQSGKWAVTHYKVIKKNTSGICYLELTLETGRTHQIRVHLSELGYPIAGDVTYGANKKINNIHSKEDQELIKTIPRFALHAEILGFIHPTTNQYQEFQVPWPDDLIEFIKKLGFE